MNYLHVLNSSELFCFNYFKSFKLHDQNFGQLLTPRFIYKIKTNQHFLILLFKNPIFYYVYNKSLHRL